MRPLRCLGFALCTLLPLDGVQALALSPRDSVGQQYAWNLTALNTYERREDPIEAGLQRMSVKGAPFGVEEFALTSAIKISLSGGQKLDDAAKGAWKQLALTMPQLMASMEGVNKVLRLDDYYNSDDWVSRTVFVDSTAPNATQLLSSLKPVNHPVLYIVTESNELVIRATHSAIDDHGIHLLWDKFLRAMAQPATIPLVSQNQLGQKLQPPAYPVAADLAQTTAGDELKAQQILADWAAQMPTIGVPVSKAGVVPVGSTRQRSKYSASETSQIIAKAKANGYSLTEVVHAALISAAAQMSNSGAKYVSVVAVDTREFIEQQFQSTPLPFYESVWPLVINPTNFFDIATQLKNFYNGLYTNPETKQLVPPIFENFANLFLAAPVTSTDPILSSIGSLDGILQNNYGADIKLQDVWLAADSTTPQPIFHLTTFNEEIRLDVTYNQAYHADSTLGQYLQLVRQILLQQLQI
ncbi:hypothetical protein L228DRAFT_266685 [Xylona heveae TC161]|uniref:Condensation domain-containing protein n=1 Tax=Xylona heveae (strain CBS 132557 / TC161) TaxID=1328760 RepID=A0A165I3U2_XYLHT|nr:hypothetical protein L228DRAFT_266685 [Xylona heveae TC161]KZF24340.1 hypothetical protein L228DRAFT_266685 [Xylona heveae TC161]